MENVMELLFLGLLVIIIVCTIILLHKISKLSRKITAIVKSVEDYLAVVMAEDGSTDVGTAAHMGEQASKRAQNYEKEHETEEQSLLISSVLQEIFP
jgi:predicted Holliday junction resolvase-like endonuclease